MEDFPKINNEPSETSCDAEGLGAEQTSDKGGKRPPSRILKWCSNFLFFGTIVLYIVSGFSLAFTAWSGLKEASETLILPEELQPFGIKTAVTMWQDSFEHDFDKYFQAQREAIDASTRGQDNYHLTLAFRLDNPNSPTALHAHEPPYLFPFQLELDSNGPIKSGHLSMASHFSDEPLLNIPIYQEYKDDTYTTYFQFQNQWYKYSSSEAGYLLGFTPTIVVDALANAKFSDVPYHKGMMMNTSALDFIPFSFVGSQECDDGLGYLAAITADDDLRLNVIFPGTMTAPLNYSAIKQFSEETNDDLLLYLIEKYYIRSALCMAHFDQYGEISEVAIPAEAYQAMELTDDVKLQLSTYIKDICDTYANEVAQYVQTISDNCTGVHDIPEWNFDGREDG